MVNSALGVRAPPQMRGARAGSAGEEGFEGEEGEGFGVAGDEERSGFAESG